MWWLILGIAVILLVPVIAWLIARSVAKDQNIGGTPVTPHTVTPLPTKKDASQEVLKTILTANLLRTPITMKVVFDARPEEPANKP